MSGAERDAHGQAYWIAYNMARSGPEPDADLLVRMAKQDIARAERELARARGALNGIRDGLAERSALQAPAEGEPS